MNVAMAIGAHPDDIEFGMAGTLLLLRRAGWETHYMNVADGSCGGRRHGAAKLAVIRRREAQAAAARLGAHWHASLVNDLEILYELRTLRRLAAVLREVNPRIVLTHSPEDYMEDHTSTCRLVVTAVFSRGMRNFRTAPPRAAVASDAMIYHALPHGLRDGLRRRVIPGSFVNTTSVMEVKRAALAEHRSQQEWLEITQAMNSWVRSMEDMSLATGRLSRRFTHAEGWRRHSHLGFSDADHDPLAEVLGANYLVNACYEASLK